MRSADELSVLSRVVDAVRAELADREHDAIPNKLRKAAGATGKNVPVPHQRSMVAHLESDEQFREAVRERWESAEETDSLTDAFLADPATAEPLVQAASAAIATRRAEKERDDALVEVSLLSDKLGEAKKRIAEAKRAAREERKNAAESDRRSRKGLERSVEVAQADLAEAVATIASLRSQMADEIQKADEARATAKRLTERESKRTAPHQPKRPSGTESLPVDPVELAEWLDRLDRRLKYYRDPDYRGIGDGTEDVDPPFRLPLGISPESSEAVSSIVASQVDRVIVDGYNVAGAVLFDSFSSREGRDAAIARADMVKRSTQASVTVVFDAAAVQGDSRFVTDGGTQVIFEPEESADDAIVRMVRNTTDRCVVVTNDRELQSRVERPNCVVVFTTALIAWSEHLNER